MFRHECGSDQGFGVLDFGRRKSVTGPLEGAGDLVSWL